MNVEKLARYLRGWGRGFWADISCTFQSIQLQNSTGSIEVFVRTDSKFTDCISLGSVLTTFLKIKRISSWPLVSNHRLEFLNGETFVNQLLKRPTTFKSSGDYFSKSNSLL